MAAMRWFKLMAAGAVAASAMVISAGAPALAATASTYSFDLATANTALSPGGGTMASPGDTITVTGSGTFDPVAKTIRAKGTFVHYSTAGTVTCQGTWKATGFTSFTDFGANDQGEEGGVLSLMVTHYCTTMGMTMTGIPMTVTSTVNAPPGYTQGITVGEFTQPTGGTVVIQPGQ
jgi:hypothetical protein